MRILASVGFEPTTSCICGKRLTARPRGPHGRERTTMLISIKTPWIYFSTKKPARYHLGIQYYLRCCSFSTVRPSWSSGKTLAANGGGRGFESHRGQISKFTLFYIVECEKLFCKTNIKLKVLKLNKNIWNYLKCLNVLISFKLY